MPLDLEAKDFLERLAAAKLPPIHEMTVAEARDQMDLSTRFLGVLPRVGRVEDRTIPGPGGDLKVRIITPKDTGPEPRPLLVYFHGGGWVLEILIRTRTFAGLWPTPRGSSWSTSIIVWRLSIGFRLPRRMLAPRLSRRPRTPPRSAAIEAGSPSGATARGATSRPSPA